MTILNLKIKNFNLPKVKAPQIEHQPKIYEETDCDLYFCLSFRTPLSRSNSSSLFLLSALNLFSYDGSFFPPDLGRYRNS